MFSRRQICDRQSSRAIYRYGKFQFLHWMEMHFLNNFRKKSAEDNIDIRNSIGKSTDGVAKMPGQYTFDVISIAASVSVLELTLMPMTANFTSKSCLVIDQSTAALKLAGSEEWSDGCCIPYRLKLNSDKTQHVAWVQTTAGNDWDKDRGNRGRLSNFRPSPKISV